MRIPAEFEQFVRCIYPGIPHAFGSLESLAAVALEHKVANERRVVLAFLNELLDGGHPDADLEYAWNVQSPSYNFSAGGHRVFSKSFAARSSPIRSGTLTRAPTHQNVGRGEQ